MEVFKENNRVVSVSFRIDFTNYYDYILNQLLEFIIHNKFILVDENLNTVDPNSLDIKQTINNSIQYRKYNFLKNNQSLS
ncbi:MAG TPA: hypothetical protein VNX01_12245 [Bacteroidia bacterium]|nr:hypothetical protein [Bacteroidia bacterium]